jgi:hypothetical protein
MAARDELPPWICGIPLERGRVTLLTVKHDAWCPTLTTGGDCMCDPEIVVTQVPRPGKPEG